MRNLDSKKILFSLMVLSLFIFVLIFVLKQPSLMDKDDPPASLRSMDFLTAAPCSPKRHVMFLKTHKTGSTTVQNMMLRHTDEAKLKLAVPDFLNNTSKYHNARHLRNSRVKNPTWFDFGYNNRQNFSEEQYTKALREIERGSVSQSQGFGGGQDTHPTHMIRDDMPRLAIKKGSVNARMKLVGFSTSNKVKNHWFRHRRRKPV
ncbi:hypothetical protein JZ751_023832 [Albula glossodonta]|uniref:Uncharacterized protein n=1 Tax=Albula glossodonta TaxID=121402 RepID=A0A8T2MR63_9TELE|nr:hypothetical protein JZ751_023832 [Albula glossodonta]